MSAAPHFPRTDGALALDPQPMIWGPPGATPDERRLRHLGQALAEVLAGHRAPETLADRLTSRAYRHLLTTGALFRSGRAPFARRVHVTEPRDGVIEMCVTVHCGERDRVLAVRLERRGLHWLCTDVEAA
ncbi:Rv3235 family protein [Actinomadura sp. ATCC 31491]|uniref:Rv3235 family protein n=1 Tax=Actinomadura luzonensis TaxID=2805427 RepID=A0ABT0G995_9ACTN|nr:Rv3235 family protein [Actinomadura luzonensis]MCK2221162.1 Rv3235 family protein [Actinomadura luzonensis]